MPGPAYHGRTHLPGGTDPMPGGVGVESIDGGGGQLIGDVTFSAGAGIVLDQVGQNIEISTEAEIGDFIYCEGTGVVACTFSGGGGGTEYGWEWDSVRAQRGASMSVLAGNQAVIEVGNPGTFRLKASYFFIPPSPRVPEDFVIQPYTIGIDGSGVLAGGPFSDGRIGMPNVAVRPRGNDPEQGAGRAVVGYDGVVTVHNQDSFTPVPVTYGVAAFLLSPATMTVVTVYDLFTGIYVERLA